MRNRCCVFMIWMLTLVFASPGWSAMPDIQTWPSNTGSKVMFVHSTVLPMVDVRIVFDAGSARDNGKSGLALLTNALLVEGADGLTAQELAESFESVGAIYESDSLRDMAYLGVRSLTDKQYLDVAIETLSKVIGKPEFKDKQFDRELARMKVALSSREQSPSDIAEETFYSALYGKHPYAAPPGGTEESLQAITLKDVKAFYEQYYVASNAIIVVVGDVDRSQVEKIANVLMRDISPGVKPPALPEVHAVADEQVIHVPYPSSQSHIIIGQTGLRRGDEDYFSLYVANHIFGGSGFASRLVKSIREDRGLAYSVYSYFLPLRDPGPFLMGMQTRIDQSNEAIELLKKELSRYIAEGPDKKELEDSISNITGGFPLNIDSNKKLLGYLAMIGFYELPSNYLNTFVDNIIKVTHKDIARALKNRIDSARMITVIVGGEAPESDSYDVVTHE